MLFVNEQGVLMKTYKFGKWKDTKEVIGINPTELWGDAFERQDSNNNVLLNQRVHYYYGLVDVVEHHISEKHKFLEQGGGWRIDFV